MTSTRGGRTTRPPAVQGVPAPRLADVARIVWWSQLGYLHGARHGHGAGRALSALLALLWWPFAVPLLLPAQAALVARRSARYYMSPERDAVLAVAATGKGWHIEDHATARPGTGRGRALRTVVLPELYEAADGARVAVYATAATAALAANYTAEYPQLVDVGRGYPRGRRMRREPQPAPQQRPRTSTCRG